jgi:hypothetical protein
MRELFNWLDEGIEPETIKAFYPHATEGEINFLQALITLKSVDRPFKDFYIFEDIITALNHQTPDFTTLEPPQPEELWHGIHVMKDIQPEIEFSPEVIIYAKSVFNDAGIYFYPTVLDNSEQNRRILEKIKNKAGTGPFPLKNDKIEDIQASHYLSLNLYHDVQKSKDRSWLKTR